MGHQDPAPGRVLVGVSPAAGGNPRLDIFVQRRCWGHASPSPTRTQRSAGRSAHGRPVAFPQAGSWRKSLLFPKHAPGPSSRRASGGIPSMALPAGKAAGGQALRLRRPPLRTGWPWSRVLCSPYSPMPFSFQPCS